MKRFEYRWNESIFLLHINLARALGAVGVLSAVLTREYDGGTTRVESIVVRNGDDSLRFIVSRSHPTEIAFRVDHPHTLTLEAFKLEDRAYCPTEPFFKSSS